VVAGGENGTIVDENGGINQSYCAPGTTALEFPRFANTGHTSGCFDGISQQDLGLDENIAIDSDDNHQADGE